MARGHILAYHRVARATDITANATYLVKQIQQLAETTDLSINQIRERIGGQVSRAVAGQIVKSIRDKHKENEM